MCIEYHILVNMSVSAQGVDERIINVHYYYYYYYCTAQQKELMRFACLVRSFKSSILYTQLGYTQEVKGTNAFTCLVPNPLAQSTQSTRLKMISST